MPRLIRLIRSRMRYFMRRVYFTASLLLTTLTLLTLLHRYFFLTFLITPFFFLAGLLGGIVFTVAKLNEMQVFSLN
jgi:hypothetical protein